MVMASQGPSGSYRRSKGVRKVNTTGIVISAGCTSVLQPLDVSINKPVMAELRKA